jgi:hypothetical protein
LLLPSLKVVDGERIAMNCDEGKETRMYRTTWKSGSLKSGKWAVGIADESKFEVAVIRGKTYQEAESRARLVIELLSLGRGRSFTYSGKRYTNLAVDEKHFSPDDLAKAWGVSAQTIRNVFRDDPTCSVSETALPAREVM